LNFFAKFSCESVKSSFQTLLVSLHKLSKYIDISQLPEIFGGTFTYDAEKWCDERERIEAVMAELNSLSQDVIQANGRFQVSPDDPIIAAAIWASSTSKKKLRSCRTMTAENERGCSKMLEEHRLRRSRTGFWIGLKVW
ncbi:hypothetical protein COOONC_24445, partial [Cooperia oncophora]